MPSLWDDLRAWSESCRDMGLGSLRAAKQAHYEPGRDKETHYSVWLGEAADILDRTVDNILGRIESLAERHPDA